MATESIIHVFPGYANGAGTKGYLGAFNSSGYIAQAATAGQVCHGVLTETVTAAGDMQGLKTGICSVVAGESISAGDKISALANGKAQVWASGETCVGEALSAGSDGKNFVAFLYSPPANLASNEMKYAKLAITGYTSTGVKTAWQNPEGATIIIHSAAINRTVAATGACTLDIGTTAVSAATTSDNLFDGLNANATAAFESNLLAANLGTNGKPGQTLASGKWVTVDAKTGDATGLVADLYIYYTLAS